jgi:hypothetical protein
MVATFLSGQVYLTEGNRSSEKECSMMKFLKIKASAAVLGISLLGALAASPVPSGERLCRYGARGALQRGLVHIHALIHPPGHIVLPGTLSS